MNVKKSAFSNWKISHVAMIKYSIFIWLLCNYNPAIKIRNSNCIVIWNTMIHPKNIHLYCIFVIFFTGVIFYGYFPIGFCEKLFRQLESTTERFEVKLMMVDLVSRLIGVHQVWLSWWLMNQTCEQRPPRGIRLYM